MERRLAPRPIVRTADIPATPWQNGGGVQRDLFAWPSADDWRVRVGVAEIEADGPFSHFARVQRTFTIVAGAGVELSIGGALHRVPPGANPVVFDGGATTTCRRLGGNSTALNLMLRGLSGGIRKLKAGTNWGPRTAACGIYTLEAGTCRFLDEEIEVPEHALLWFDLAPPILSFGVDAWAIEVGKATTPPAATETSTERSTEPWEEPSDEPSEGP